LIRPRGEFSPPRDTSWLLIRGRWRGRPA
jgi:hypothetical protein